MLRKVMDYLIMTNNLFSQFKNKFLIIKTKYYVIESSYMQDSIAGELITKIYLFLNSDFDYYIL